MSKKNITTTAFILTSLCARVTATATAKTYIGATVGNASWSEGCAPGGYSCQKNTGNSTAFKLLGDYVIFSDNLSGRFDIDSHHTRLSSKNFTWSAYTKGFHLGLVSKF